ncbi:hypothetical protein FTX61_09585 [Nitriliruptoraceae bacterium ZYF776]|nr:hypothetical protein [Profundirhabdus halotolerans]
MAGDGWLPAGEAAARLGVKRETLYAYVARGQLRRRPSADGRRSEYAVDDLDRLGVRGHRGAPARREAIAVRSTLTRITPDGPRYRGHLAVDLAGSWTFEEVVALLWRTPEVAARPVAVPDAVHAAVSASLAGFADDLDPVLRLPVTVIAAAAVDPLRGDTRPGAVHVAGYRALAALVTAIGGRGGGPLAAQLARGWRGRAEDRTVRLLDATLVLLADHELAASTLAARAAASTRADPYAVVLAGLAVLGGSRHGTASRGAERALRAVHDGGEPDAAIARHVALDVTFGHPLYPDGDPRATRLFELVRAHGPARRVADVDAVLAAARDRGLPPPSVDLALAAVTHVLAAPVGTGGNLFALARTAGWSAHALEQQADGHLLRPRAVTPTADD